jgi:hypothetical protein
LWVRSCPPKAYSIRICIVDHTACGFLPALPVPSRNTHSMSAQERSPVPATDSEQTHKIHAMVMNLKKANGIGKSHDNTDENQCMRSGRVANSRPPAKKACSFFDLLGLVLRAYQALPCPHRLKSLFPYHPWNCAGPSLKSGDPKETNCCRRMVQTKALTTSCQQLRVELLHPPMALHQWKPTNCLQPRKVHPPRKP